LTEGKVENSKMIELNDALVGRAIENTLVRYDRVAFFSLGEKNILNFVPPDWLLTHIDNIWKRLRCWVLHRQNEKSDTQNYHPGYVKHLMKLAEYYGMF
jgi:hypothetical protein